MKLGLVIDKKPSNQTFPENTGKTRFVLRRRITHCLFGTGNGYQSNLPKSRCGNKIANG